MIKLYKRFACWIGDHSWPYFDIVDCDGCNVHAKCRWCGFEGMIDSQGNIF